LGCDLHLFEDSRVVLAATLIINDGKVLLLYRKDHQWFETPGGKVRLAECRDPSKPQVKDYERCALRELKEELGDIKVKPLEFFCRVEFSIPGRELVAYKFTTELISGEPKVQEPELFAKAQWLPIDKLKEFPLSPDLKLICGKLSLID